MTHPTHADAANLDLGDLRKELAGDAFGPSDPGWDDARRPWNLAVDQRPAAVVYAESADDVAAVVRFAAASGLRVAPQGTGHGASGAIEGEFALYGAGSPMTDELKAAIVQHFERVGAAMEPFSTGGTFLRLRQVKTEYDSGDLFRSNHPILPA